MSFERVSSVVPDELSRPFWDACKRNDLIVQRCEACSAYQYPPMDFCSQCQHDKLKWERSAGLGTLHSVSTVFRPQSPEFEAPYVVAIVFLDEGWFMVSNVVGCEPKEAKIGDRVEVTFTTTNDGFVLPHFKLSKRS